MTSSSFSHDRAETLTKDGIVAYRAGQRQQAMSYFVAATQADRTFAPAWLWLAEVQEAPEDKRACLEQVLLHNPHHKQALAELRRLPAAQQLAALFPLQLSPPPVPSSYAGGVPYASRAPRNTLLAAVTLVMLLSCVLLVLAFGSRPRTAQPSMAAPFYATEAPPAGWHQIAGARDVRLWVPPHFAGGNRGQFRQIMVQAGFNGQRVASRMDLVPDDAVLALDKFVAAPHHVYAHALSYVQAYAADGRGTLDQFVDRHAGRGSLAEASRETYMLGPQGTVEARRLWFEPTREDVYPALVYAFKHDAEYWLITFNIRTVTPQRVAEFDQMVRTLSINVEP